MYHGSPQERAHIRKETFTPLDKSAKEHKAELSKFRAKAFQKEVRRAARRRSNPDAAEGASASEDEEDEDDGLTGEEKEIKAKEKARSIPVIVSGIVRTFKDCPQSREQVTTYEMIIKDAKHLAHLDWGYIVVDEGHRLKNFEGKLITEIKKYDSSNRLILTGTPLHVGHPRFHFSY